MTKLTEKQKKFVEEYLIDLNATQACIRAGYAVNNAGKIGHELLEKTRIREEIDKAIAERSRRTGINQDRVLEELAKLAFCNAKDVIDFKTGAVREDAKAEDLACIQSIKTKYQVSEKGAEQREIQITFCDKKGTLELLGKHLGMFKDRLELDADHEIKITVDYGEDSSCG